MKGDQIGPPPPQKKPPKLPSINPALLCLKKLSLYAGAFCIFLFSDLEFVSHLTERGMYMRYVFWQCWRGRWVGTYNTVRKDTRDFHPFISFNTAMLQKNPLCNFSKLLVLSFLNSTTDEKKKWVQLWLLVWK